MVGSLNPGPARRPMEALQAPQPSLTTPLFHAMPTPEITPALEAFRQQIKDLSVCFEQFVSALDPDFIASLESATCPAQPATKAGLDRTPTIAVRDAMVSGWSTIGAWLSARPYVDLSQLALLIEPYIDGGLRHDDLRQTDSCHIPWHSTVGNAIRVWPARWGEPLVEHAGRNRWRLTEYGRSIL